MCLMNGYAVFKVPGEAKKDLSLYLPLSERSNNLFTQKVFQLLSILFSACGRPAGKRPGTLPLRSLFSRQRTGHRLNPFFFGKLHKRGM